MDNVGKVTKTTPNRVDVHYSPGCNKGWFELLSDLIVASYPPPFQAGIWKLMWENLVKNKMRKDMKISLLLIVEYWTFRGDSMVDLLAMFERLLDGFSAKFLVEYKLGKWGFYSSKLSMQWRRLQRLLLASLTWYMAGSIAAVWLIVVYSLPLCFFVVGMFNDGWEMAGF